MGDGPTALAIRCDRWQECQRRLDEACERLDCPHRDQHPLINGRLDQLERRAGTHDGEIKELTALIAKVDRSLSNFEGQITGAVAASKVSGAVVGAFVSAGASGAIALLVFLLGRH